jgi:hypothetical protein
MIERFPFLPIDATKHGQYAETCLHEDFQKNKTVSNWKNFSVGFQVF